MQLDRIPLITTDGFEFYEKVIRRVFGPLVSRPGDQDTPKRSRGEGGAKNQAWKRLAIETGVRGLGGS